MSLPKPTVTLTCAYTRTGKDHLGKNVQHNTVENDWMIYGKTKDATFRVPDSVVLISYASSLKKMCLQERLHLSLSWQELEPVKDTLHVANPDDISDVRILRQWYIDFGAEKREINKDYWCIKAFEAHHGGTKNLMVTDFRFYNEYEYTRRAFCEDFFGDLTPTLPSSATHDLQTIRLYRSCVKVPDANIASEHNLDKFQTGFLGVTSVEEFFKARELFPQYKDYVLCNVDSRHHYMMYVMMNVMM